MERPSIYSSQYDFTDFWTQQIPNDIEKRDQMISILTDQLNSDPVFLDPKNDFQKLILATFNRCGSTMLRFLIERIFHVYSNHDFTEDFKPFFNFHIEHGMQDYAPDEQCLFTKTHFNHFLFRPVRAQKCILLVRNPFDAIVSYYHLKQAGTHDKNANEDVFQMEDWEDFMDDKMNAYKKLYEYWLNHPIPKLIVRYEDLIANKKQILMEICMFILNVQDLKGTLVERKIEMLLESEKQVYKPRPGGASVLREINRYSKDQLEKYKEMNNDVMFKMGYFGTGDQIKDKDNGCLPLFQSKENQLQSEYVQENNKRVMDDLVVKKFKKEQPQIFDIGNDVSEESRKQFKSHLLSQFPIQASLIQS